MLLLEQFNKVGRMVTVAGTFFTEDVEQEI
jgi:hypothetical protein